MSMSAPNYVLTIGQRWTSEFEPELGLGIIQDIDGRTVTVCFPASSAIRRYSTANAPLIRALFHQGDRVTGHNGDSFVVTAVTETSGLLTYSGDGSTMVETDLSDLITFSTPEDRLLTGRVDPSQTHHLRHRVLTLQHRAKSSPVRGFVGGRIDLIPHQLYIASEVTKRYSPRVLLADEVGLGKTIEACLILHRLLVSGRIARALILVPENLLHQWLVELLRRFNLKFSLFDEERCAAIEEERPDDNPFLDDQLILTSINLLTAKPKRSLQAANGDWDIVVIDEAHRLGWDIEEVSPEYATVEPIAKKAKGLLLLTATPEQLGIEGHYARLRLLDPSRYPDLDDFIEETAHYRAVARLADALRSEAPIPEAHVDLLSTLMPDDDDDRRRAVEAGDRDERERLLTELLDKHGTGRVLFRNTRAVMRGFPKRRARLANIDADVVTPAIDVRLEDDLRIPWLIDFMASLGDEKVLLICSSRETAVELEAELRKRVRIRMALFHEGLTLIQRDRNAAYFADPEGSRLLICSEIGSEGRNFQFVRHLVLYDLPIDPDLVEQRIGRLDRIGQKKTIEIHVPWATGTAREVLVRWLHEGLNAFEKSLRGGNHLFYQYGEEVATLAHAHRRGEYDPQRLEALISDSIASRDLIDAELRNGHDHLLELSSFRAEVAEELINEIESIDRDRSLPELFIELFEHLGVYVEEIADWTYRLNPEGRSTPDFPEIERGDVAITFDRSRALDREDYQFWTWDHPLIVRAMEILLVSEHGTSAFVRWPGSPAPLALEATYLLEIIAPDELHIDRFLATVPIRVVVDNSLADQTSAYPVDALAGSVTDRPGSWLIEHRELTADLLPKMVERSRTVADQHSEPLLNRARGLIDEILGSEVARLESLLEVNANVRSSELTAARSELAAVVKQMESARLRLDSVRLITA